MICVKTNTTCDSGFTLIEVIVTIIAAGILALFFINYMGTAMDYSSKSVELVIGEAEAEGIMEEIIAYYTSKINSAPDGALSAVVGAYSGGNVSTAYIDFNSSGDEIPATGVSNNLKVTVEAPGNNLTTILTKSRKDSSDPKVDY